MGCGSSTASSVDNRASAASTDSPKDKALDSVVPVPGDGADGNSANTPGKPCGASPKGLPENGPAGPDSPHGVISLYNRSRIICSFESAETHDQEVLWQLLTGQSIAVLPPPSMRTTKAINRSIRRALKAKGITLEKPRGPRRATAVPADALPSQASASVCENPIPPRGQLAAQPSTNRVSYAGFSSEGQKSSDANDDSELAHPDTPPGNADLTELATEAPVMAESATSLRGFVHSERPRGELSEDDYHEYSSCSSGSSCASSTELEVCHEEEHTAASSSSYSNASPFKKTVTARARRDQLVSMVMDHLTLQLRLSPKESQRWGEKQQEALLGLDVCLEDAEEADHDAQPSVMEFLRTRLRPTRVKNFKLWHVAGHPRAVRLLALSHDNKLLVTGDGIEARQNIMCCETPSDVFRVGSLAPRGTVVEAPCDVAFSTNGQVLVACDQSDTILIWDMTTFRCKKRIHLTGPEGSELFILGVAISPNANWVAAAADHINEDGISSGRIVLWNCITKKQTFALKGHNATALTVAFSPDSSKVASGSRDGAVIIWSTKTGEMLHQLASHPTTIRSVGFSPCGNLLLTADPRLTALWGAEDGKLRKAINLRGEVRTALEPAVSPKGSRSLFQFTAACFIASGLVAIACSNRSVKVFTPADFCEVYSFPTRAPSIVLSPSARGLALGDLAGNVYLLDIALAPAGAPLPLPPPVPASDTDTDGDGDSDKAVSPPPHTRTDTTSPAATSSSDPGAAATNGRGTGAAE